MGESPDLIDYTALLKRGLIKKKEVKRFPMPISKDGFVDFSAMGQDKINEIASTQQTTALSPNPSSSSIYGYNGQSSTPTSLTQSTPSFTSFWDQLPGQPVVQSAQQTQSVSSTTSDTASYYGSSSALSTESCLNSSSDLSSAKAKLEDLEYKLTRLTEKIDKIASMI